MISIIVPTYNEVDNIYQLVKRISDSLQGKEFEIIVVDDNSEDNTYEKVKSLSEKYPVKAILRKEEKGLSSAVVRGFVEARGHILGVIDADLQHPPEAILNIVFKVENGFDIAIGSRLVVGGDVGEWTKGRKIISFFGRVLAMPLTKVLDTPSGFFFFKKEVINGINWNPIGYKILLEVLVKGKYDKLIEVPYSFKTRSLGESKIDTTVCFHYLIHIKRLYEYFLLKRYKRFLNTSTNILNVIFSR